MALCERQLAVLDRAKQHGLDALAEGAPKRRHHDGALDSRPVYGRRLVDADRERTEGRAGDCLLVLLGHELLGDLLALGAKLVEV